MKYSKPICIIPARAQSKRIKNKNILKLLKKPLIAHVIKIAHESKLFSKIIVSTDSPKIAKIANKYGALTPFLRKKKLSGSKITIKETLVDCINRINSKKVAYHFCLYATSIFLQPDDLKKAFKKIKKFNGNVLLPVVRNLNSLRSFKLINKNEIRFYIEKYSTTMSQDLPELYSDSGTFFILKTEPYLKIKSFFPKKIIPFYIEKYKSIDLNDDQDLKLLKLISKGLNK